MKRTLKCSECSGAVHVVSTKYSTDKDQIIRRKRCNDCGNQFWTLQYPEVVIPSEKIKYGQKWQVNFVP